MATLTSTLTETITLNGQPINSDNIFTIDGINYIDKRLVAIPTASEVTVLNFGSAVAAGTVISANVKYIRITNTDTTNFVRVRVKKTSGETFDVKIEPKKTFMLGNNKLSASSNAASFSTFVDADSILAQANTAAVTIELFVASI